MGEAFEAKVAQKESSNPKFAFLKSTDAYHTYYRTRVSYYKRNNVQPAAATSTGIEQAAAPADTPAKKPSAAATPEPAAPPQQDAKVITRAAAETVAAPRALQPPPKDRFSYPAPHIPLKDLFAARAYFILMLLLHTFTGYALCTEIPSS